MVATALSTVTAGRGGPWGYASPVGFEAKPVFVYQSSQYQMRTEEASTTSTAPSIFLPMVLNVTASYGGGMLSLASAMAIEGPPSNLVALQGPELRLAGDADVPLTGSGGVLNRWSGPAGQFANLVVSEESGGGFNLCWHVELMQIKRLACNTFDRNSAQWIKSYIIDDSGNGVQEYR